MKYLKILSKKINIAIESKPQLRQQSIGFTKNEPNSNFPFTIGSQVAHKKFGQGTVISYEGSINDLRIQVQFKIAGTKWLALEFAKLDKL